MGNVAVAAQGDAARSQGTELLGGLMLLAIWNGETIVESEIHSKLSQDEDYKAEKGKVKHWLRHPWSWFAECPARMRHLITPGDERIKKVLAE
eukprot:CAMPEP_0197055886 /NCGR_PEP_ID=MMETSP1384-20130603/74765_1 /TAXON_ID=29189 /ORGANISM="Ammonia sp." /LENGTH=92 /DNA_ID=CAMNT_0042489635 /DNA_START=17 /DNA_END=292 /DNA_ORIENTATION=+